MNSAESLAIVSCATKAPKRIPERDSDLDQDAENAEKASDYDDLECMHVKRFRSANIEAIEDHKDHKLYKDSINDHDKINLDKPMIIAAVSNRPSLTSMCERFNENLALAALSPIAEISMNMSETSLDTSNKQVVEISNDIAANVADDYETPLKSWTKVKRGGSHKFNQITAMLQRQAAGDNDSEPTKKDDEVNQKDKSIDDTDYQMPSSTTSQRSICGVRRLNMDAVTGSSLQDEMAIDELSFYDDDETSARTQQSPFTACPQLMGLLSPEGSPQRFHIIERPTAEVKTSKFLQPLGTRQQKHAQNISTNSSNTNTPAKNFRLFHSLSSGSMESASMDDEYMELFEMESLNSQTQLSMNFPSDLNSLISGQIKHSKSPALNNNNCSSNNSSLIKTPEMRRPSVRRCLSMTENYQQLQQQPNTPELLMKQMHDSGANSLYATSCFKRPEPPTSATCSPVLTKRYRSAEEKENLNGSYPTTMKAKSPASVVPAVACPRQTLRKSMSMNDAEILSALARSDAADQPDLIGDFSKPFVLPLMDGRHRDLKSVSSDTVARLLNGEFDDQIANYKIIDCRYPYEYEGGHIRGAKNLYTQEQIIEEFLTQQKTEQQTACSDATGHKRNIIIFHCEFSSERGPKLSRFLRNNDRARNTNLYPALDYPEIYLLHNGYKEFFEQHASLCDPQAYRPMLEPAFSEAYRHFRAKSKSWNGDGLGGATSRLKKSRSRLLL